MSSEIENTKEEGENIAENPKKPIKQTLRENWQVVFKIVELLLCVVCVGLIFEPAKTIGLGKSHLHHVGIMYTSFTGYILINSTLLLGRYMGDRVPFKMSTIFSVLGAAMFLITGILLVADRSYLTKHYFYHPNAHMMVMLTASTCFAFLNAGVFSIDGILTFRRQEQF